MIDIIKELYGRLISAEAKLLAWNLWAERQIKKGLMDEECAPKVYDSSKNHLQEIIDNDKTFGYNCHWCGKPFKENEAKVTDNHIMWFHANNCQEAYYAMENKNTNFEQE